MILYKYYGFNAGIAALGSQKLGFREPRYFNDPFELSYLDNSEDSNFVVNKIEQLKKSLVILSLTRTPYNPLMWAHYGDEHRGFVIGYDIENEFFQSDDFNVISVNDGDVVYTTKKERIEVTEDLKQVLQNLFLVGKGEPLSSYEPQEKKKIIALLRKALLYKHSCWSYEEEVRAVKVLDSDFEESHVWQANPNRSFSTLSKLVAPGIGCMTIPGLNIFKKQANIKEVYLGMRNPLLKRRPDDIIKDNKLIKLAEELSWEIHSISMSAGSWELESKILRSDALLLTDKTKGLINSFNFNGVEANFLTRTLLPFLESADDSYELTNWSGELALKKNGEFIA